MSQSLKDRLRASTTALEALKRSPMLRTVSLRLLASLAQDAEVLRLSAGEVLARQGEPVESWYVLIDGTVKVERDGRSRLVEGPSPLGEVAALMGNPWPGTVTAQGRVLVAALNAEVLREKAERVQALGRALRAGLEQAHQSTDAMGDSMEELKTELGERARGEILVVRAGANDRFPIPALTHLMAQAIAESLDARVALMTQRASDTASIGGVDFHPYPDEASPQALEDLHAQYPYIVLDDPPDHLAHAAHATPVMLWHRDSHGAEDLEGCHHVVFLEPRKQPTWRDQLRRWATIEDFRLEESNAVSSHHGWCVHLRMDLAALERDWQARPALAAAPRRVRESLGRLARTVTHRRVGIALGGSGAWGYAHVALLRHLTQDPDPVPIDVVAGVSSGSVFGAYFCANGAEGLDKAISRGESGVLDIVVTLAIISSWFIEALVNCDLGVLNLEELEVPFIPVCTDLTTNTWHTWLQGPMGLAVRSASAAPGLFSPTLLGRHRLVDGCVVNNVPVSVLAPFADMIIASNAYPMPERKFRAPKLDIPPVRFLRGLNLIARTIDLLSSADLMLHTSGDWQSQGAQVRWDAGQTFAPLLGAMLFNRAEELVETFMKDPSILEAVEEARQCYKSMAKAQRTHI